MAETGKYIPQELVIPEDDGLTDTEEGFPNSAVRAVRKTVRIGNMLQRRVERTDAERQGKKTTR